MSKTGSGKTDYRTRYTLHTIRVTFLALLEKKSYEKITVTEICKIAGINRGTFYLHYKDVGDVLDSLIDELLAGTRDSIRHLLGNSQSSHMLTSASGRDEKLVCPNMNTCSYPFCEMVRSDTTYQMLFMDDATSARVFEKITSLYKEPYVTFLMQNSTLSFAQAEAVFYFHFNGCLTVNRLMIRNHTSDWRSVQQTIDTFIRSGLESFLVAQQ